MDNIIEVKEASFVWGRGTPFEMKALDGVSVGFERGRITGLIGHTGSGKSTLVSMLNGILTPTEGQILLDGESIFDGKKCDPAIRFRVGLVMQYPEYQLFDDTVRSDIGFGPRNQGLSDGEIETRVAEAARFAGIGEELLDKAPFELSGGQMRRVAIAGVIAMRPDVLVLDEPAAGLDPRGRVEILGRIRDYARESGATVILVSHSMEDMAQYCDNVVVMNSGRVAMTGSVSEVFSHPEILTECGLEPPSVSKIAEILSSLGIELEGSLYTVRGVADAILKKLGRCEK